MSCPRCGGVLTTYQLDRQQADVCEDCGFVGITRTHGTDAAEPESWEDALMQVHDPGSAVKRTVRTAETPEASPSGEEGIGGPTVTRRCE